MTLTSILGKLKICLRLLPFAEHSRLMREEFWFKLNDHGSYARRLPYITDLSETISLFKSFKIDLKFLTVEAWRRVLNFNQFWNALNVRWQVGRIIHNIKMQPVRTVAKQLKTIWENITQEHLGMNTHRTFRTSMTFKAYRNVTYRESMRSIFKIQAHIHFWIFEGILLSLDLKKGTNM